MFVDRVEAGIPEPAVFYDETILAHEADVWGLICDSLSATSNFDVLFTLRFVNRKLSRISTQSLLAHGIMWKLERIPKLAPPRLAFEQLELQAFDRNIPKMPLASLPPGGDEFHKVLTLVPLHSTLRTAFGVEVIDLPPVFEGDKFQSVEGRLGFAASSEKSEIFDLLTYLSDQIISLWAFDPLLHKESQTPDNLPMQSFHDRLSMSLDDYCQYLAAMERFYRFTLPSSKIPICPTPYRAFITFHERPNDKIAPCIVAKARPCEHVVKLVSATHGKPRHKLLSEAGTAIKEFMESGWEILYCEKYLYRNRQNGDIFISVEGLTKAQYLGNNVLPPEEIKVEVVKSVKRLEREWQEFFGYESDDSSEYRGIIFPPFSSNIPIRKVANTV